PKVTWWIRRTGFPGRRYWVYLSCDRPCQVPPLVVVRARPGRLPGLQSGQRVAELVARAMSPGQPLRIALTDVGGGRPRVAQLGCFVADEVGVQIEFVPARKGNRK